MINVGKEIMIYDKFLFLFQAHIFIVRSTELTAVKQYICKYPRICLLTAQNQHIVGIDGKCYGGDQPQKTLEMIMESNPRPKIYVEIR